MRQIIVQVPVEKGPRVVELAEKHQSVNVSQLKAVSPQGSQAMIFLYVANNQVGPFLENLSTIPEGKVTLNPHEVLPMTPPDHKVADTIARVTNLMMEVGQISAVAALLPTITGAVGAMNLMEPERNSLVPGTAVGSLVAASLAPPAGVAGMATSLQEWTLVTNALFVLALQLAFITLSGALAFRFYGGVRSEGSRYQRGRSAIFRGALAIALLAGAGLLFLQFHGSPALQRSTKAQRAAAQAEQVINESSLARFVSAEFRFTEPSSDPGEILLGTLYVQRAPDVLLVDEEIENILVREIQNTLLEEGFDVTPLLTISVLEAPEQGPS